MLNFVFKSTFSRSTFFWKLNYHFPSVLINSFFKYFPPNFYSFWLNSMRQLLYFQDSPINEILSIKIWQSILSIKSILHNSFKSMSFGLFLSDIFLRSHLRKIKSESLILFIFNIAIWRTHELKNLMMKWLLLHLECLILFPSQRMMYIVPIHYFNQFLIFLFK